MGGTLSYFDEPSVDRPTMAAAGVTRVLSSSSSNMDTRAAAEQIRTLQAQLRDRDKAEDALRALIAQRDQALAALRSQFTALDSRRTPATSSEELAEAQAAAGHLRVLNAQLYTELRGLKDLVDSRGREVDSLRRQLDALSASRTTEGAATQQRLRVAEDAVRRANATLVDRDAEIEDLKRKLAVASTQNANSSSSAAPGDGSITPGDRAELPEKYVRMEAELHDNRARLQDALRELLTMRGGTTEVRRSECMCIVARLVRRCRVRFPSLRRPLVSLGR